MFAQEHSCILTWAMVVADYGGRSIAAMISEGWERFPSSGKAGSFLAQRPLDSE
jgi:hypothetical protein